MRFQIIYADPPWNYTFASPTASPRPPSSQRAGGVNYYYDTMTLEQIKQLQVKNVSEKDSVLYLWATTPLLPEAFEVMKAWGFIYKTTITWKKLRCKGMGYWFRGHTEHLLFGVRGKVKAFRSMQPNIVEHLVLEHSKKPEIFRHIIENATPKFDKRLELFATQESDGWNVWGNRVSSVDINLELGIYT